MPAALKQKQSASPQKNQLINLNKSRVQHNEVTGTCWAYRDPTETHPGGLRLNSKAASTNKHAENRSEQSSAVPEIYIKKTLFLPQMCTLSSKLTQLKGSLCRDKAYNL